MFVSMFDSTGKKVCLCLSNVQFNYELLFIFILAELLFFVRYGVKEVKQT